MTTINVRNDGETCALLVDGTAVAVGPWQAFDELAGAMRRISRKLSRREQAVDVLVVADGDNADISIGAWSRRATLAQVGQLSRAIARVARIAESTNNLVLTQQVADGALLARAGLPFGLSDNPKVKDEIAKVAATDTTLRKAMPFAAAAKIPGIPRVRHVSNVEALNILRSQHASMHKDLYGQAS